MNSGNCSPNRHDAADCMEAVILAGGKGTRLRPYTTTLPKPLVPVGEEPILAIVLRQLQQCGFTKVTLAVSHLAELIMTFFGSGEKYGLQVAYSIEDRLLGTVAPIKRVDNLGENFLVMNGDILTDLDYRMLWRAHMESGAPLTIAAYPREVLVDFGVLDVNNQRLSSFREKPTYHFTVSMGVYMFNRSLLNYIEEGQPYSFDQLVLDLLDRQIPVNIYKHQGYWLDLGRPDDYDQANRDITSLPNKVVSKT
jgi:NDP-sugar pyrophosphorylase family protein